MDPNINLTDGIINIILIGDNNIAILQKIFQYYRWLGKQPVESTDDSTYQIRLSHQGLHSNSIFRIGHSEPEYDISPMHTTGCPLQ